MPVRKYYNDAGADVFAPYDRAIYPGQTIAFPLGFGIILPDGFTAFVFSRSSLSVKGIVCASAPIDAGYMGEIHALVSNISNERYDIKKGDRIGQLVILPYIVPEFTYEEFVTRGTRAFGSSGK